jgi:flagellar biosynthetic protein FlhB
MSESTGEKIHPPTPRRRQQARAEGRVARSHDLVAAALLLAGLALLWYTGGELVRYFGELACRQWGGTPRLTADADLVVGWWQQIVPRVGRVLLPALGLLLLVAAVGHGVQTGFLLLPQKLAPDFGRLSPARGLARIGSTANGMRLMFALLKLTVIVGVVAWCVARDGARLVALGGMEARPLAAFLVGFILATGLKVAGALVVLGLADYAYQRWRHERDLWMTTAELREELRNLRVDPVIASRRRHLPPQCQQGTP